MDAIQSRRKEEDRLAESIGAKKKQLIDLIREVNTAKDESVKAIDKMKWAVLEANKEYQLWIEKLEILQLKTDKLTKESESL